MYDSTKSAGAVPIAVDTGATTIAFEIGNPGAATETNGHVKNKGAIIGVASAAAADNTPWV